MKKLLLIILISLLTGPIGYTQSGLNTNTFTWFGIDYTHCYFLTPIDFPSLSDLEDKIGAWNNLVKYEREKYIEKTLKGKTVSFATEAVEEHNETIDVKSRLSEDLSKSSHLDADQVQAIINNYNIPDGLSGTGLVLIAESYDKPDEKGNYYVTFFDIGTKEVFSTERMSGKASGFGFRNYWAGSFYDVLKNIGKKYK